MNKFLLIFIIMMWGIYPTILSAQDAIINVVYVNDTHSNLLPGFGRNAELQGNSGGIARAVSVIGYAKMQDPETLLLHAGDLFIGDLSWYLWGGVPELGIMQSLGIDAMTIGNHEFDATTSGLVGILQQAEAQGIKIPLLSANLIPTPETAGVELEPFYQESITKEVNGIKVGIFGMTSEVAMTTSLSLPDIVVNTDYAVIAAEQVAKLKNDGCKVIIFLSHLGMQYDKAIAGAVDGINVIISSHDHFVTETPVIIPKVSGMDTYIVSSGSFYQNVGSIQIEVKNGEFFGLQSSIIPLDENIPEEPNTVAFLTDLFEQDKDVTDIMFRTQVAECIAEFDEKVEEPFTTGDKSTAVGCLVTLAYLDWGHTDVAFTTSGLTSQPLFKGAVIANDVFRMLGYGVNEINGVSYQMVKFKIKGEYLIASINAAIGLAAMYGDDEFLPQASGMKIYYPSNFEGTSEILINNSIPDPERIYTVTTTSFVQAFVEQMLQIPIEPIVVEDEKSEFDVVLNYVINQVILNPADFQGSNTICSIESDDNTQNYIENELKIFPNPAKESVSIELTIDTPGNYEIDAFNTTDLKMHHLSNSFFDNGTALSSITVSNLPSGNYILRIKNDSKIYFGKLNIVR